MCQVFAEKLWRRDESAAKRSVKAACKADPLVKSGAVYEAQAFQGTLAGRKNRQ